MTQNTQGENRLLLCNTKTAPGTRWSFVDQRAEGCPAVGSIEFVREGRYEVYRHDGLYFGRYEDWGKAHDALTQYAATGEVPGPKQQMKFTWRREQEIERWIEGATLEEVHTKAENIINTATDDDWDYVPGTVRRVGVEGYRHD